MNRPAAVVALVLALAAACDCGGAGAEAWVGVRDLPRVVTFEPDGAEAGLAVEPPALDAAVRALVVRRDGGVIVLQEPEACLGGTLDLLADACVPASARRAAVPPALLLSRRGTREAAFAFADALGTPFFTAAAPPWAAAEDAAGRVWITGGTAPVVYDAAGRVALVAEALPFLTRGVAALPGGGVAVSFGVQGLAVYDAAGAVTLRIEPALPAEYDGIDALASEGGGALLLASRRFGTTSSAVVLRARIEGGALVMAQDPALSAGLPGGIPSALLLADGKIATAPSLGRLASPACGRWLSPDLAADLGCVVPGPHRGLAWVE